eukprot:scaffold489_cov259-Pinguiococcus_pyrenoidosus.AAC.9
MSAIPSKRRHGGTWRDPLIAIPPSLPPLPPGTASQRASPPPRESTDRPLPAAPAPPPEPPPRLAQPRRLAPAEPASPAQGWLPRQAAPTCCPCGRPHQASCLLQQRAAARFGAERAPEPARTWREEALRSSCCSCPSQFPLRCLRPCLRRCPASLQSRGSAGHCDYAP